MRRTTGRLALTRVVAALLLASVTVAQTPTDYDRWEGFRRHAEGTDMLRRMAEIGGPVGTHEDYLRQNPLRPARFGDRPVTLTPTGARADGRSPEISILVDTAIRPAIDAALNVYAADLLAEGYAVYIDDVSGGTPAEIRDWVGDRYAVGSEGVVFVGGITVAWFEVPDDSPFPCDLFYMDVDGDWTDASGNGINDTHAPGSGDLAPEVYVGRLYTPTLTWDSEADLINAYLQKAHAYRVGTLTLPRRGLEFIDHDWIYWFHTMGLVYDDVVRWDWGHLVRTDTYLSELARGYHYVHMAAHSGPDRHYFSSYPTNGVCYAHIYVHSPYARPAKIKLGSCDGIKVWFDGDNVLTKDTFLPWHEDQFETDIWMRAGWHRLLCKISTHGSNYEFSARFTFADDSPITDLLYQLDDPDKYREDPFPIYTSHIDTWLLNGLYENSNNATRLSQDYLGNEADVTPSEGDIAAYETWDYFSGNGCPVDLADHYESVYWYGVECESQFVQDADPQAFFYNLFACSSGRITETNYLSAAYILNTTYGLGCVASSRSGSMTVPELFASSFGDGNSFGQAYADWWISLEPHYSENIGWWYGLILNGDPTLRRDQAFEDCNQNSIHDPDEIAADPDIDCDENGIPDDCDFTAGRAHDCNGNDVMDSCDIAAETSLDCNGNEVPDECDLAAGVSPDCNNNDVPDECDIRSQTSGDCNHNSVPDECDIDAGLLSDIDGNGVPDECEFTVRHVNAAAPPGGNGLSWGTAYNNLTTALSEVASAPVVTEIWVAAGTYTADVSVAVLHALAIYGGFAGTEADLAERDWLTNETILDGDDYQAAYVAVLDDCGSTTRLDGFTIRRGNRGVYVYGGSPSIANCRITDNHGGQGSAIRIVGAGKPQFIDCVITGNSAGSGGGVYNGYGCDATFTGCTFSDNVASQYGGAVWNGTANSLAFINTSFRNNSAVNGGAIFNEYDNAIELHNVVFWGNSADSSGGAIYNAMATSLVLRNCTLAGNSAPLGPSIACAAETPEVACNVTITNCILWDPNPVIWNYNDVSSFDVTYSDVSGGWAGDGNIAANPLFAGSDDVRLLAGSPCIDAGNNAGAAATSDDLDGNPRFVDDPDTADTGSGTPPVVDMGAYEFQPAPALLGDLNCDQLVNTFDIDPFVLAITNPAGYAAAYPECDLALADCNDDGLVNTFDIDPFVSLLTGG